MSFRRDGKKIREKTGRWVAWLAQHRSELSKCGLPEIILQDEEHWWDCLMHGHLNHHVDQTEFDVQQLTDAQANALFHFLKSRVIR